jgi:predicted signal transduction protein with EAL and GGDEF domain
VGGVCKETSPHDFCVATIGSTEIEVSPSIGIAVHPGDGITAQDLLESADVAMYAAKQRRSGCSLSAGRGSARSDPGATA